MTGEQEDPSDWLSRPSPSSTRYPSVAAQGSSDQAADVVVIVSPAGPRSPEPLSLHATTTM